MNRETIYAALFAKLRTAATFKTASRRLKMFTDVAPPQQPALFVVQRTESPAQVPGLPPVWTLTADVYVYAHTQGNAALAPSQIINPLLDALIATLAPDQITNKCTLGGLVQHAWIEGAIETDEGVLGDQAVAVIPIVMKAV